MNRLKELRIKNNLTLDDIETKTGIKRGTYSNYENNKTEPKIETWQRLADYFNVSTSYLMGLNSNNFGNRIKELRIKNGLSQAELAEKIGVKDNTICQYEKGKRHPNNKIWQKLADCFNVSIPSARDEIDTELIAKIAKMVFLIETTSFYTNYGQTRNVYDNSKMICKLMLLLFKQLNLSCSEELQDIVLKAQKILNDKKYDSMWGAAKLDKPVDYLTAKKYVERMRESNGIDSFDVDNITKDIEDAKKLIDFYDNL